MGDERARVVRVCVRVIIQLGSARFQVRWLVTWLVGWFVRYFVGWLVRVVLDPTYPDHRVHQHGLVHQHRGAQNGYLQHIVLLHRARREPRPVLDGERALRVALPRRQRQGVESHHAARLEREVVEVVGGGVVVVVVVVVVVAAAVVALQIFVAVVAMPILFVRLSFVCRSFTCSGSSRM